MRTFSSQLCFYVSSEKAHKIWEHRIADAMKLWDDDHYTDLYAQFGVAEVAVKTLSAHLTRNKTLRRIATRPTARRRSAAASRISLDRCSPRSKCG